MSLIKACGIALSMYSRIPMPAWEWKTAEQKYVFCFFPLIGVMQGALFYGLFFFCQYFSLPGLCFCLAGTTLPVLFTGGIHMDGFLDTLDGLHSYQEKERRLEILKDPHTGAFAVIGALVYFFLYAAGLSLVKSGKTGILVGIGFVLSRTLSAVALLCFKKAKQEGLLYGFSENSAKKAVMITLGFWFLGAFGVLFYFFGRRGIFCLLAGLCVFGYYRYKAYASFGGTTGDVAGWFVCLFELVFLWCAAW